MYWRRAPCIRGISINSRRFLLRVNNEQLIVIVILYEIEFFLILITNSLILLDIYYTHISYYYIK